VATGHRLTIRSTAPDPRSKALEAGAAQLGLPAPGAIAVADVVLFDADLDDEHRLRLESVLIDPLLQSRSWDLPLGNGVEVTTLAGVTNSDADAVMLAAGVLGVPVRAVGTARRFEFDPSVPEPQVDDIVARLIANPIVERWSHGTVELHDLDPPNPASTAEIIPIRGLDDDELLRIDRSRALSLDLAELHAIRAHYEHLERDPTDVELETFAQTWSEHCAHKTFRAVITVRQDEQVTVVPSLLGQLRASTDSIDAPFVRSAFVGNAGVIEFTPGTTIAVKAETHNHPSAVEPFGGANTGVGGVIRDVLGMAHRPVAITDVLCFGPAELPIDLLPDGSLHPLRIRSGVVDGVADYGNKIGLPTVGGAVLYDPAYTTNPLVFAGCIGVAPARPIHDGPHPGDRVVVLGGATGRDGIRGATFSSTTMDATTGAVAGASVQIGDPIIEKLLIDALVGAEDLYSAITDCGAGGLSSAVGEMAEGVGADIDLALVPRKYPGLEPWEVWLSEAQERMVVSIRAEHFPALVARCQRVGVVVADIGTFTGDRQLLVRSGSETVADIDTGFLHDGRPTRHMEAVRRTPDRSAGTSRVVDDPLATIVALLAHPNISSKEAIIRRYDHEILGSTLTRPLIGPYADGHGDGAVIAEPTAADGFAIGIGVNPWYGLHDPEAMAFAAVDEAVRNVVAVGADPDRVALLDNFSWGDPRRPSTLGDLVAAVDGCCDAAAAYRAPFVSGKDSLNNEYFGSDGQRHAVPPTLVITAIAHVPDADACITADLVAAGNVLLLVGATRTEFAGSHLDMVNGEPDEVGCSPAPDLDALDRYRRLHAAIRSGIVRSCHDLSEGGFAIALAEMCIAGRLGATIDTLPHHDVVTALFSESIGRLLVEIAPADVAEFTRGMGPHAATRVGVVTEADAIVVAGVGQIALSTLVDAFTGRTVR
jgi:phosphoribosylformylglycinamidine synthase subunit PurSL